MSRAQQWHETDHGTRRGKPLRDLRYRRAGPEVPAPASVCWCCCTWCDPATGTRPNPFFTGAIKLLHPNR